MNKNTYLGLALAACLSIVSTALLAEAAPEHPANITEPATSATEPQEPSELQKQHAEHDKANITEPSTSATEPQEPQEPSELQRQHAEHNKAKAK